MIDCVQAVWDKVASAKDLTARCGLILVLVSVFFPAIASAQSTESLLGKDSVSKTEAWQTYWRVISLQDYNTRVVVLGVAVLGAGSGLVGSFTLLRKRALMGDALSHASLPGIGLAFIIASALGQDGKSLSYLLLGATLSGLLGVAAILWIHHRTRLKEDTALGIVLSVFFGAGVAILSVVQQMDTGNAAGLEGFIYGKTASMRAPDVSLIAGASAIVIVICCLNFKELKLLCFDEGFAGSRGYWVVGLDVLLMSMVVLVTIVGLQAVGLILVIALMVIPAAAARFWTESLWKMTVYSSVLGLIGCVVGAMVSAMVPDLPSGATIVLVCAALFFFSMMFGTSRGVLIRTIRRRRLNRRIERQHLLRAMYEATESRQGKIDGSESLPEKPAVEGRGAAKVWVTMDTLLRQRSWSRVRLIKIIHRVQDDDMVRFRQGSQPTEQPKVALTRAGLVEGARLTRQHRLWEMYLIAYAEVAPALVDRDADDIEHVLDSEIIDQLEDLLEEQEMQIHVPDSPHVIPGMS